VSTLPQTVAHRRKHRCDPVYFGETGIGAQEYLHAERWLQAVAGAPRPGHVRVTSTVLTSLLTQLVAPERLPDDPAVTWLLDPSLRTPVLLEPREFR
jgi:hypothetical protein